MILNGRMFKFSVPTPGDHRSPLRTDGVSCAKSRAINGNLQVQESKANDNFQFSIVNLNSLSIVHYFCANSTINRNLTGTGLFWGEGRVGLCVQWRKVRKTTLKQSNEKNCKMSHKCYVKYRKLRKFADICRQLLSIADICRRNPIRIQSESEIESESEPLFCVRNFLECKNQKIQVCSPIGKRKLLCLRI